MRSSNIAWILIAIVGGCALLGLITLQTLNFNRLGADAYYTKIEGAGAKVNDNMPDDYIRYEYDLPAYKGDGASAKLPFTAAKQLRQGAYLKLFVKEGKGVTSYQEVSFDDIPEAAQKMFG
ncbi:YxeA family protein [Paenibacillus pinisoli]|uniref:YxeA family protein n=1 Tax=Paenibacillus pinisoli TaxID=1276110 RepID=A0A3A6PJF6_9BACL|nr:YxeA family protein [Paenibacillus pinisoli]RJX40470.1 YxeA family protein [Paenibacillus pinisoli]